MVFYFFFLFFFQSFLESVDLDETANDELYHLYTIKIPNEIGVKKKLGVCDIRQRIIISPIY